MDNENRKNNSFDLDDIPELDLDILDEIVGTPSDEPQVEEEPVPEEPASEEPVQEFVETPMEETLETPEQELEEMPVQELSETPEELVVAPIQEPVVAPVEELVFGEEDKVVLFDDPEEEDDLIMIFDEIETDLSTVNEEEEDDDLVFIDAVSVRDRRKINKLHMVEVPDEMDVEKKKTRRRTHDVTEIKKERSINFAKKNIVFIGIGILVLIIIIGAISVGVRGCKEKNSTVPKTSASTEAYQVKEQEAINALMTKYYTAVADNDTYVLNEILNPVFDNEMEYIRILSEYVDAYNNIVCYAKDGAAEGQYIVAAYYELKYAKIKDAAPGMQFFYLETNADGELYINNLYSEHNMVYVESEPNADIMNLILAYQTEPDMQSMLTQVQDNYAAALEANQELSALVTETLPGALTDWSANMEAYLNVQPDVPDTPVDDPATPDDGTTTDPATGVTETPAEGIVYANDNVNVRQTPSTEAAKVASLYAGAEVKRLATTDNGWTKVQTGDVIGYIRSDFISDERPAGTDGNGGGNTVTVNVTLKIRAGKSTESDIVEMVTEGQTVTIVEGDSEGWTKVSFKGVTGYIRTDVLY